MEYPCLKIAEYFTLEGKQELVVKFISKNVGTVVKSTNPMYEVGKQYNDWRSAENTRKWKVYRA